MYLIKMRVVTLAALCNYAFKKLLSASGLKIMLLLAFPYLNVEISRPF